MNSTKITDPWSALIEDDFLDWDRYKNLEETFPDKQDLLRSNWHGPKQYKRRIDGHYSASFKHLSITPEWSDFIDSLTTRDSFRNLFLSFEDDYKIHRPKLLELVKSNNFTYGWWHSKDKPYNEYDISFDLEFEMGSMHQDLNGLEKHLDSFSKAIQRMVYFRNPLDTYNDSNIHLCTEDLSKDVNIDYICNRSLSIPLVPDGWHYVTPRHYRDYTRKKINVIFNIKDDLQEINP